MTGASYGYIVSHQNFKSTVDGNYTDGINCTVTLTNLTSGDVQIDIEYLDMEGLTNNNCSDKLVITSTTPRLPDICSPSPSQFTAHLSSNWVSFQFITNSYDEGNGFWLKYSSKCILCITICNGRWYLRAFEDFICVVKLLVI